MEGSEQEANVAENIPVHGDGEVTPVDSNPEQQLQRSKEILTESRCREAMGKNDLVEDSVPQILESHRMKFCMSWMSRLLVHLHLSLKFQREALRQRRVISKFQPADSINKQQQTQSIPGLVF